MYTVSSTTVEASQTGSASARATASIHQDDPAPSMSPGRINLPSPSIDTSTTVVSSPKFARGSNSRAYGYLGYTSYCTVIEETLSILDRRPEDVPHSPCMDDCPVLISPKTLTLGVTILRHIPYPEDGQRFFRKDCTVHDGWVRLTAQHILDTLYTEWGDYLGHARSISKLEDMTRHISVNTAKSVVNNPDANAWLDQFRGPNLRWESIGMSLQSAI